MVSEIGKIPTKLGKLACMKTSKFYTLNKGKLLNNFLKIKNEYFM